MPSLIKSITRRKTDQIVEGQESKQLKRCLALKDLTMIGIGSTLGAGVYILAGGVAANKAGPAVTLCFGIAAIASILSGMCYAELGCRVPKAGSGYAYLYVCIGELAAFTIGWCLLLSYILGASSVASALSDYLSALTGGWVTDTFDSFPLNLPGLRETLNLSSIILICLLGLLMIKGIDDASKVTNVCTAVNICTLAALILLMLFNIDFQYWSFPTESDTENQLISKSHVDDFYKNYLMYSDGIQSNIDTNQNVYEASLVGKYCVKDTYQSVWSKEGDDVDQDYDNNFQASCILKDEFNTATNIKSITSNGTTTEYITLPGKPESYNLPKYQFNSNSSTITLADIFPGAGGYIPFGLDGVLKGATTCFYGFVGFDAIATTGEEAINPQRDIPRAIVISLMVICFVYLAISGLLTLSFPYFALLPDSPFPITFYFNNMSWIIIFIKIGAICALTSSLIGAVIPMPRILWNMAQDGLVFDWCSKVSKKSQTPINATIIATVVAALLAGVFKLDVLVDVMSIGTLAAYALVALCVLILRYRPDQVDLDDKVGPNEKQGEWSTKLIYAVSGWYLFAGIVMQKISIWFPDESSQNLCNNVYWGSGISILAATCYVIYELNKIPQSTKKLAFNVPLLPYFPLLNLIINLYLMAALELKIWIQLVVWLAIGYGIYFGYGIDHSVENNVEKEVLLSSKNQKENEANQV